MHVGDTIFIFCLALIIFGPKKLPEIGRQIGKLMVEFRRASNEFKMQIEEELRAAEQAERQKEISAASTMLPSAASSTSNSSTAALPAPVGSDASTADSSTPTIAPPATGLPVSHTDPSPPSSIEPIIETTNPIGAADASPEHPYGFDPALNTASNGQLAEIPAETTAQANGQPAAPTANFQTEVFPPNEALAKAPEPEPAQATVHHG
jgi:sec-independent protein translocase protein TatB